MTSIDTERELTPDTVLVHRSSPEVEYVEIEGETVIYDCAGNALHLLDQIGTVLWSLLDGTVSLRTTGEELAAAFGRPVEDMLADVMGFAQEMVRLDLAERVR